MSLPQLRLDDQVCFLFHRVCRELDAAYRVLLAPLGVTYPQYLVMLVLWERDGIGVGDLGERLALDSGTLSPLLRRMERAGLVSRARDAADERRVTVRLTPAGRSMEGRAAGVPAALAGLVEDDPATYEAVRAGLRDLVDRLVAARAGAAQ